MPFDTIADDYESQREETASDDTVWIRRFSQPVTTFRIVPIARRNHKGQLVRGTRAWITTREHFNPVMKLTFPCVADDGEACGACADANERIRRRDRRYYFPALDSDGVMRVYKMGRKLWLRFQNREDRLASAEKPTTLSDRDYTVVKSGSGLDTEYEIEAGEAYKLDFKAVVVEQPIPDIPAILEEAAAAARRFYKTGQDDNNEIEESILDEEDLDPEPRRPAAKKTAAPRAAAPTRIAPAGGRAAKAAPAPADEVEDADAYVEEEDVEVNRAQRKATKKAAAVRRPAPPVVEEEETDDEDEEDDYVEVPSSARTPAKKAAPAASRRAASSPAFETFEDIEGAPVEDLRTYLQANDVEFPARAPRERLTKMVAAHLDIPAF